MEGITTKILLIVAGLFLFATLVVTVIIPAVTEKGNGISEQIKSTNSGASIETVNYYI